MLNAGMAVTDLDAVTTDDTSWTIKVTVAFGDDLIVYDKPTDSTNCKSVKGNQFCAVASLKKSVTRRLSN